MKLKKPEASALAYESDGPELCCGATAKGNCEVHLVYNCEAQLRSTFFSLTSKRVRVPKPTDQATKSAPDPAVPTAIAKDARDGK